MKNRVRFSALAIAITAMVLILSAIGIISVRHNADRLALFCLIMGTIIITGLCYCPVSVEAGDTGIALHRLLSKPKRFAYTDIQHVEVCYPSICGIRLCASGGCFGYWGYFSDYIIGAYFGYYGSRNHCFLVKMKNGRQYALGCEDPVAMVNHIKALMQA